MSAAIIQYDDLGLTVVEFLPFDPNASSVLVSETWTGSSVTTDFPVEEGAAITDHVRPTGEIVTLEVFVTNSPTKPDLFRGNGKKTLTPIPTAFSLGAKALPNILDVSIKPSSSTRRPGQLLGILGAPKAASLARIPSVPPLVSAWTLTFDKFDPVQDVNTLLKQFRDESALLTIQTSEEEIEDMVIVDLSRFKSQQEGKGGARFTISFKKIVKVSAETVSAPTPLEPRALPKVNKGSGGAGSDLINPRPLSNEEKRSVLSALIGN